MYKENYNNSQFAIKRFSKLRLQDTSVGVATMHYWTAHISHSQTSQTGPGKRTRMHTRQKARAVEDQL